MGLLDEAIREHLELKRRHGADPSEVARLEGEVFGPSRRQAASDAAELDELDLEPSEPQQSHLRLAEAPVDEPAEDELGQETRAFEASEVREALGAHEDAPATAPHEAPAPVDERLDRVPDDDERAEDERAEDVLDETPEFLAETPEHDRLWFEQRPPRDFDF